MYVLKRIARSEVWFAESSIKDVAMFHATFSHNRGHVFDKNLAKLHDIYKKWFISLSLYGEGRVAKTFSC